MKSLKHASALSCGGRLLLNIFWLFPWLTGQSVVLSLPPALSKSRAYNACLYPFDHLCCLRFPGERNKADAAADTAQESAAVGHSPQNNGRYWEGKREPRPWVEDSMQLTGELEVSHWPW